MRENGQRHGNEHSAALAGRSGAPDRSVRRGLRSLRLERPTFHGAPWWSRRARHLDGSSASRLHRGGRFDRACNDVIGRRLRTHANSGRDLKRLLTLGLRRLPYEGHGWGFSATTIATTFAIGVLAQVSERGPSWLRDMLGWFIVAFLTALVAAIAARFIVRALPDFVAALIAIIGPADADEAASCLFDDAPIIIRRERWFTTLFSRPPPLPA